MEAAQDEGELLAGRYRLDRTAGHGGMAVVFVATDIVLERQVAIKIFQRRRHHGAELHERFLREARAEAAIVAPEVVTVHDVGETDDGRPFLVLEYVDGQPLSDLIGAGPLDEERVASIGADVARALQAAHELGIVHRDVKPANVLIDQAGRAKLGDFGLARVFDEEQAALTAPGTLVGSAHYVAPEQVRSGAASPRSDLYALGAMLYHVLVGAPPFEGVAAMDIAMRRLEHRAPRVLDRVPGVDPELAGLIEDLLQRNPERRPASAGLVADELAAMLERFRGTRRAAEAATIIGAPLPRPGPRRRTAFRFAAMSAPLFAAGRVAAGRVQPAMRGIHLHLGRFPEPTRGEAGVAAGIALFLLLLVAAVGQPPRAHPALVAHPAATAVAKPARLVARPAPGIEDVRGRDAMSATRVLVGRHYQVALFAVPSGLPAGTVVAERPLPGSSLPRGAVVSLDVAVGGATYDRFVRRAKHGRGRGNGDGGD